MIAAALRQIFPAPCAVAVRDANTVSAVLPPEEAAVVANAVDQRKREFAAGREAARDALRQVGFPAGAIGSGTDRAPRWPEGAIGSIAHAGATAIAVVARRSEIAAVGLDIERDAAVHEELWRQILGDAEIEALRRLPGSERARWATIVFSAKEAFYKFQYPVTRAWLEFVDVAVAIEMAAGVFRVTTREPLTIGSRLAQTFDGRFAFAEGFVLAGLYLPAAHAAKLPGSTTIHDAPD